MAAELTYEAPVGPAPGPSDLVAEAFYGGDGHGDRYGGASMPADFDPSQVVELDADAMARGVGAAKQYDFVVPPPREEVKIAANVWSRTSGQVEQQYKASSTQKRKNQINSLAAEAATRSHEVYARGSKGMKSKKETAAKYGW